MITAAFGLSGDAEQRLEEMDAHEPLLPVDHRHVPDAPRPHEIEHAGAVGFHADIDILLRHDAGHGRVERKPRQEAPAYVAIGHDADHAPSIVRDERHLAPVVGNDLHRAAYALSCATTY
jgi:hypothetical protein